MEEITLDLPKTPQKMKLHQKLKQWFTTLPFERKLMLILMVSCMLFLVIGSVVIVSSSLISLNNKPKQNPQELLDRVEGINKTLQNTLETNNSKDLEKKLDENKADFTTYSKELDAIKALVSGIEPPLSSPVNN